MDANNLIHMANRIGDFFDAMPDRPEALEGIAQHIKKFWEPRMRRHLFELLESGRKELLPLVVEASALIRRPEAKVGSGVGVGEDAARGAPGGKGPGAGESLSEPSIPESAA